MATKTLYKIISGEGTGEGHTRHALATDHGIKCILTRERCGGDRWARAFYRLSPHDTTWIDSETGEARSFLG